MNNGANQNNFLEVAKTNFKPLKKVLLLQIIIITIMLLIKPDLWLTVAILNGITIIMMLYSKINNKDILKTVAKNSILIIILWNLFHYFGKYGFWGLVFVILLYSAYILYRRRKQYIEAIEQFFVMVYGKKPGEFKKGELKNTKIKFKRGKK